jgi:hypothetical protein
VQIANKSLGSKIILDAHGDKMTGHESKNKTKEWVISSYRWPGMGTEIEINTNIF